jgi:hypothetical protein
VLQAQKALWPLGDFNDDDCDGSGGRFSFAGYLISGGAYGAANAGSQFLCRLDWPECFANHAERRPAQTCSTLHERALDFPRLIDAFL